MNGRLRPELPRYSSFAEPAHFGRPRSACDMAAFYRHRQHNISQQPIDRAPERPRTVNRYDYLGQGRAPSQPRAYPSYHSLNHLNVRKASRSPALDHRDLNIRSNQTLDYNKYIKGPPRAPLAEHVIKRVVPRDIKPSSRDYLQVRKENAGRNNQSVDKLYAHRFQNFLKDKLGHRRNVQPVVDHKSKGQRRLNQHVNSPLGLNLDVILTESIIQVPSHRQYR